MEDKESLDLVARAWGVKTHFCQESSTGNSVWRVVIEGKKAVDFLALAFSFLAGEKERKARYLLAKYKPQTSLPVRNARKFTPFSGMK